MKWIALGIYVLGLSALAVSVIVGLVKLAVRRGK